MRRTKKSARACPSAHNRLTTAQQIADKLDDAVANMERGLALWTDDPPIVASYAEFIAATRRLSSDLRAGVIRPSPVQWTNASFSSALGALRAHGRDPFAEQHNSEAWQRDAELLALLRESGCKNPELMLKGRYSSGLKN